MTKSSVFLYRTRSVTIHGTTYTIGSVVALASDTLPVFGQILNILMVDVDDPYFVCEIFHTEDFDTHLHAYVVSTHLPVHITLYKQAQLMDHHTLGLYKLCLYDDTVPTFYIVPKYVFANDM